MSSSSVISLLIFCGVLISVSGTDEPAETERKLDLSPDFELAGFSRPQQVRSRPQVLLPNYLLNSDGFPKPASQLPQEIQSATMQDPTSTLSEAHSPYQSAQRRPVGFPKPASQLPQESQSATMPDPTSTLSEAHSPYQPIQRRPAGVYDDPAGLYEVTEPPEVPEPSQAPEKLEEDSNQPKVTVKSKETNSSDVILELNPNSEDLEFVHENSTYTQKASLPNFSAKIFTLSYAGIKKPVLIVQPETRASEQSSSSKEGNPDGTRIPTFTIRFPLQSNSQFQIPRFNFTLPTLFLPGLVFTQNENIEKNTHEIHVSIPESVQTYESFPTSHVLQELELLLQAPNFDDVNHHEAKPAQQPVDIFPPSSNEPVHYHEETYPEKYNEHEHEPTPPTHYRPQPREPPNVPVKTTIIGQGGNFGEHLKEWKPLGLTPLKGHGLDKMSEIRQGSIGSFHNKVHQHQPQQHQQRPYASTPQQPHATEPPRVQTMSPQYQHQQYGTGYEDTLQEAYYNSGKQQIETEPVAETQEANPSLTDQKYVALQATAGPVQIVPLNDLRPLNAINTLLSPFISQNASVTHPKWQLPSIGELYNKIFGSGRMEGNCFSGRNEGINVQQYQHSIDDDPALCGSDGLCGVTCNRLGFFLGKCIDEISCVCVLKDRPEFGLKLEYYVDRRSRSMEDAFPAFGLCHLSACRLNCERSGFLTGVCDNTCLCGSPWAEKMRK